MVDLLKTASPFFATIPKARTAKIVRTIIDIVSKVPDSVELQDALCRKVVAWCKAEKRNFLRQRIQSRQAGLVSTPRFFLLTRKPRRMEGRKGQTGTGTVEGYEPRTADRGAVGLLLVCSSLSRACYVLTLKRISWTEFFSELYSAKKVSCFARR